MYLYRVMSSPNKSSWGDRIIITKGEVWAVRDNDRDLSWEWLSYNRQCGIFTKRIITLLLVVYEMVITNLYTMHFHWSRGRKILSRRHTPCIREGEVRGPLQEILQFEAIKRAFQCILSNWPWYEEIFPRRGALVFIKTRCTSEVTLPAGDCVPSILNWAFLTSLQHEYKKGKTICCLSFSCLSWM